jgi:signal transduction histidine kinase
VGLPQIALWLLVFGLTWARGFERLWQPTLTILGLLTAALVLGRLAPALADEVARLQGVGLEPPTIAQQKFYFGVNFAVLIVSLATMRLPFRWAAALYGGALVIGTGAFLTALPPAPMPFLDARFVFFPALLIVSVLLLAALPAEQLARRAFFAGHQLELANLQLEAERNDEKRRREATEGKLQILAQAIGGIVHDLGNPLTTVQMGASTLDTFLDRDADKETLKEFTAMIGSGAQMLNFLRLSLIEQTRVLEGKPTPVELKPVSLRAIVEAGARFQKPRTIAGRTVQIESPDARICADEMKMTTVFMNLIGNALKYSDGEVCVEWRECEEGKKLIIAVLDGGTQDRGLTPAQAARLFTAFGRLDTHSQIEGTGLGLLSVQKIVEAHGGAAFIEGFEDGTPTSPRFSTAQGAYPPMLHPEYRTAFVVTCPLAAES